jgi:hypothetical protein
MAVQVSGYFPPNGSKLHTRHLRAPLYSQAYVVGEQGLCDELNAKGIATIGGPADNGRAWDWGGAKSAEAAAQSSSTEGPPKQLELDPEVCIPIYMRVHILLQRCLCMSGLSVCI